MIISDIKNHKGLTIEGTLPEVSAECVLIMREIYKKNKELYSNEVATGILTNMLIKAINENISRDDINWGVSEEEKMGYTD